VRSAPIWKIWNFRLELPAFTTRIESDIVLPRGD
jgi:hypothetical protein